MSSNKSSGIETGEVSDKSEYVPLSDEELKKLALGVINQQVFGTWSIHESDMHLLPSIFMIVAFMEDIDRKRLKRDGIIHVYEWMNQAGPRAINGYPMFMSANFLDKSDSDRLSAKMKQITEALDKL